MATQAAGARAPASEHLTTGDRVALRSRRGSCEAVARLSEGIRLDTVFMPFHYAGAGAVNRVTNAATDPVSGMPELKVAAVRLEAIGGAA